MKHRPKLLFLSQTLPFPPDGGVKIRTYNILRLLARAFDITGLCFFRRRMNPDPASGVAALRSFAALESFPIPQEHSTPRLIWDHVRSLTTRRVYTVATYESTAFLRALEELVQRERFDLVHADSLDLSGYFPVVEHLPTVCVHHDAQSALLRRRAEREPNGLRRWYLMQQAELMVAEERRWCPRVAMNVTVSDVDQRTLAESAPGSRFLTVPNGVDTTFFSPRAGAQNGIVFVGGATWLPNADGMSYFCDAVLPRLRAKGVTARVQWVGRVDPARRQRFEASGVEVTGYVDDVRPYVHEAACYIVPIRIGGGTRVKILDAWAMGKAVVSTSIGCEGLDAVDGENILVRDDPEAFADAVQAVLERPDLRQRLGWNARRTVEERYSWEIIGPAMIQEYLSLARDSEYLPAAV